MKSPEASGDRSQQRQPLYRDRGRFVSAAEQAISGILADFTAWHDDALERDIRAFLRDPVPGLSEANRLRDAVLDAMEGTLVAARAELAEREVDWRAGNRGRLFGAGLAEMEAERKAIAVYEGVLRRGAAATKRVISEHNRRQVEAEAAARTARKSGDRALRILGHAALNLAMAAESEWHPDSDAGRALVHAARAYQMQTEGVGG